MTPTNKADFQTALHTGVESISPRTWISIFGCMLGALMSSFDIQVTNASLPEIEGGIGTGGINGTWISTAYLIGEMIMIPMSEFLRRAFTFRRVMLGSTIAFIILSIACSFTTTLPQMIVLRALQGFSSGAMIPLALTRVIEKLPLSKQPIGIALFALTATLGPTIGPVLGGYLTTHFNWRYIFYVNVIPGSLMLAVLFPTLEKEKTNLSYLKRGDWLGIITLAIGLSTLQTALDQGTEYNWFDSPYITKLLVVAGISIVSFCVIEFIVKNPLFPPKLLSRDFFFSTTANFLLGSILFATVYVLPNYLTQVFGYDAEQVGFVMIWGGLPQIFVIPMAPYLLKLIGPRLLATIGFLIFAVGCFMNTNLALDFAGPEFFSSNIIRAIGKGLILTPLSFIAFRGVPAQFKGQASAMFNTLRNLGGAVGTSLLATVVAHRTTFHANVIGSAATSTDPVGEETLRSFQEYFLINGMTDPILAFTKAQQTLTTLMKQQALIMGYSDAFYVMGWVLLASIVLVAFTRSSRQAAASMAKK